MVKKIMIKVGIIGGGISGLMAAYSLSQNENIQTIILDQGNLLQDRSCPILQHKVDKCIRCASCSIMSGIAGAGAFSDGKYNITTEFGGWLQNIVGDENTLRYIERADEILVKFGATKHRFLPDNELKKQCLKNGLYMLQSQCKHLGTDDNFDTMLKMQNYLISKKNVTIYPCSKVESVEPFGDKILIKTTSSASSNSHISYSPHVDYVIFAVGRVGSNFFANWCNKNKVKTINNQVDIGVRVELPSLIWDDIDSKIYEPKILYRTKQYGDICRMFCHNPHGEVVNENTDGIITVNGHAYSSPERKTNSTNFALLSTINFTQPFNQPIEYARDIAALANKISGGSVIVQTLGDLEQGRRSDESRIKKSVTKQTLKTAVAGDLSLCMPKRQLDNIIETLHALDNIAQGTANKDTLLYGVECKYYSARPVTNDNGDIDKFEITGKNNYYAIGDGAGFTRSLGQAAANGLMVAETILNKVQ